ncbi:hypothetical protein [Terrisporobacter mayombei]|uniref:Uncharacterized protein n=1 Tax=Terrisporobacter mayombei TaxID=1541 RepID=A0ABY9PZS3_9FIRM|nr:hypothetical protein [Terrisporobacter mayombei]MCC3868518.1 hypothetical protein [Terrisporobacter mayombei]WMT80674.1 hypothetical protein TEMA_09950 [Terrisporobacter mayombei]
MDATSIINSIYKQEVANAVEQKVLYMAQLELAKEQLKEKDKIVNKLQSENIELENIIHELQEKIEPNKEEVIECMEN